MYLPDGSHLSDFQRAVLIGAYHTNCYVSASESGNPEFSSLVENDYLEIWSTIGGFPACRVTEKGRKFVKDHLL